MPASYSVFVGSLDISSQVQVITINRRLHKIGENPAAGQAQIGISNEVGSLSPELNAAMIPNALVSIQATDTDTTTPYTLFTGYTKDFQVSPSRTRRTLTISAQDRAKFFSREADTSMQIQTAVQSIFEEVFSSIGMASVASVDVLNDIAPYAVYNDLQASNALGELLSSGGHRMFIAKDGNIRVKSRTKLLVSGSSVVNTYNNEFAAFSYNLNDDGVQNEIRISSSPRKLSTVVNTISFLDTVPVIGAGKESIFYLEYHDPDNNEDRTPASSVTAPVATTDWLLNTSSNGGGTDLTAQGSVTASLFTRSAKLTVRNTSSEVGYLTKLQIRGYSLQKEPQFTMVTEVASSQAVYDIQVFRLTNDLIPDQNHAQTYSEYLAALWASPRAEVRISPKKNLIPDLLDAELADTIDITEPISGVSSTWLVNDIQHTINLALGQEHSVSFGVEPITLGEFLVLDGAGDTGKLDIRKLAF